jgi:MFS family permease
MTAEMITTIADYQPQPQEEDEEKNMQELTKDKEDPDIEPDNSSLMDRWKPFIVLICGLLINFSILGNFFSFGVYFTIYLETFNSSKTLIATIGALQFGVLGVGGIFAAMIGRKVKPKLMVLFGSVLIILGMIASAFSTEVWHLCITQGIIVGIGSSFAYINGISVVGQWFHKYRGVATGIVGTGSPAGQLVMAPLTNYLISAYGWRRSLLIQGCSLGAIVLVSSFGVLTSPKSPVTKSTMSVCEETKYIAGEIWALYKNRQFLLLNIATLLVGTGMIIPYYFVISYAKTLDIPVSRGALILLFSGIAGIVGRTTTGVIADYIGAVRMFQICVLAGATATICWLACDTFVDLVVMMMVYSVFSGGFISLIPSVLAELMGIGNLPFIACVLFIALGTGNFLSPVIGGVFMQSYSSYSPMIVFSACCQFAAFPVILLVLPRHEREKLAPLELPESRKVLVQSPSNKDTVKLFTSDENSPLENENL